MRCPVVDPELDRTLLLPASPHARESASMPRALVMLGHASPWSDEFPFDVHQLDSVIGRL